METTSGIDEVWNAITDIDYIKRWLAREGTFSAHVGGSFNLALRDGYDVAGRLDVFLPASGACEPRSYRSGTKHPCRPDR